MVILFCDGRRSESQGEVPQDFENPFNPSVLSGHVGKPRWRRKLAELGLEGAGAARTLLGAGELQGGGGRGIVLGERQEVLSVSRHE